MLQTCTQNLDELKRLIEALSDTAYSQSLEVLSGASIGQHIRHIIELYQILESTHATGTVNYDLRKRDSRIETERLYAMECIGRIQEFIAAIPDDRNLTLEGNFSKTESQSIKIHSTLYRELCYNLEHAIHHQALIKIGLTAMQLGHLMEPHFGVASATVRFQQSGRA